MTKASIQICIRTTIFVVTMLPLSGPAGAARRTEMYRMEPAPHHASADLTESDLEKAIIAAAERSGWFARARQPGVVEAEKSIKAGKHTATVEIFFDEEEFQIKYLRSHNLSYDPDRCRRGNKRRKDYCREVIHPHYNTWVQTLAYDILREISVAKPSREEQQVVDTAAPARDPSLVADELIKLKELEQEGILTPEEFEAQKQKLLAD